MPRAYLYGFGIPKVLAGMVYSPPLLKRGEVILPPELAAVAMTEPTVSESFTTATDVWSFGILAYVCDENVHSLRNRTDDSKANIHRW